METSHAQGRAWPADLGNRRTTAEGAGRLPPSRATRTKDAPRRGATSLPAAGVDSLKTGVKAILASPPTSQLPAAPIGSFRAAAPQTTGARPRDSTNFGASGVTPRRS